MLNKQLKDISQSKLSKALNRIVEDKKQEERGFMQKIGDGLSHGWKTITF